MPTVVGHGGYLRDSQRWTESRRYFLVVWSTIAAGSAILLSGFNQPLLLLVIAACLNGMVMFVYSILLIQLNRGGLPPRHSPPVGSTQAPASSRSLP